MGDGSKKRVIGPTRARIYDRDSYIEESKEAEAATEATTTDDGGKAELAGWRAAVGVLAAALALVATAFAVYCWWTRSEMAQRLSLRVTVFFNR